MGDHEHEPNKINVEFHDQATLVDVRHGEADLAGAVDHFSKPVHDTTYDATELASRREEASGQSLRSKLATAALVTLVAVPSAISIDRAWDKLRNQDNNPTPVTNTVNETGSLEESFEDRDASTKLRVSENGLFDATNKAP